jgi:hypothetical protein
LPILIALGTLKRRGRASLNTVKTGSAGKTTPVVRSPIPYLNLYTNCVVAGGLRFEKLSVIILSTIIVILFKQLIIMYLKSEVLNDYLLCTKM